MRYLRIGTRLASLVLLGLANLPAIAAEECGKIPRDLAAYSYQCSVNSKINVNDGNPLRLAESDERTSCLSNCIQVYSTCKTSRGRDCRQEYKTCSWTC